MKISAKAEYACLAVLELALRSRQPEPARLTDIAQPSGIPERFLVQILQQLKGAGFVSSSRGAAGGYHLSVEPQEITLWEVIQAIEGPTEHHGDAESAAGGPRDVLNRVWNEINERENEILRNTNFAQLVEQVLYPETIMYYI